MEAQWGLFISSLQDIYNANSVTQFDPLIAENWDQYSIQQLHDLQARWQEHLKNVNRASDLLENAQSRLQQLITTSQSGAVLEDTVKAAPKTTPAAVPAGKTPMPVRNTRIHNTRHASIEPGTPANPRAVEAIESITEPGMIVSTPGIGRSFWASDLHMNGPIEVGSEVAYKPRKATEMEWIQCEVIKVSGDGTRFEVRDPEPDEYGKTGKVFKSNWKEILFIPTVGTPRVHMPIYPSGTQVVARYPETTTFYPAIVISTKRDGTCKLRFEGEEEVGKETEVTRRLVLPYPMVSAHGLRPT